MSCRCNCGYTCGGPGKCEVFRRDVLECIEKHFVKDCDHDFSGELKKVDEYTHSVECQKCGMSAMAHDCWVGP